MKAQEAINTDQPPHGWGRLFKRLLLWIAGMIALLAAILWIVSTRNAWTAFRTDLTTYHGATIGMTKMDVQYELDTPQTVQGPEAEAEGGWKVSTPLRVNPREQNDAIPQGYDPIPAGKSTMDYDAWHFWSDRGSFELNFNDKSHRVESIACHSEKPTACDALFGIGVGSSEEEVLRLLGKPDKQEILGGDTVMGSPVQVAKTMDYNNLGLHLVLAKKAVTTISKTAPQNVGFLWWFTHGQT